MVGHHALGRDEDFVKLFKGHRAQEGLTQAEPITVENRDYHYLIALCLINAAGSLDGERHFASEII